MNTYFRLISYAKPFGRYIVPYFLFSLLSILFNLINLTLIIPVLHVLFGGGSTPEKENISNELSSESFKDQFYGLLESIVKDYGQETALLFICIILIISIILTNLFKYLGKRIIEKLRANSIQNLRQDIFQAMSSLQIGFFTDKRKGDIMSRLTTDTYEVEVSITSSLSAFFHDPISLIAQFIALFIISPELTLFSLIIIPASGILISVIAKSLKKDAQKVQQSLGTIISIIDETLGGLKVIKAFNASDYILGKFEQENKSYARKVRRIANKRELASPLSEVMGVCVVAAILYYGGSLVFRNESPLPPEDFIGYIAIFSQVLRPAKAISGALSKIQRGIAAGERILQVIDTKPTITNHSEAKELDVFKDKISFHNVSFSYAEEPVLSNINFDIKKGETVALVGPSGGGKSTISDLIPRFYDIETGTIRIDGVNIKDYSLLSLRSQMGIVTQQSILFNDTIFNNIAFASPNANLEDVIQAAKIANAHEFILQTENGYDTIIGDRGSKLSGGQQQRISIARAIFKNPPILILDEATSSLDTESEKLVQEALFKLMQNRTSLVIAHRLSTIQNADKIIVLDKGEIVEVGTHQELIGQEGGVYKKLQLMQG